MSFVLGAVMFGGFVFWSVVLISSLILFALISYDRPGWGLVMMGFLFAFMNWITEGFPMPEMGLAEWLTILVGYFVVGALYVYLAWWIKMRKVKRWLKDEYRGEVKDLNGMDKTNDRAAYDRFMKSIGSQAYTPAYPPSPAEFKDRIVCWVLYWPVCALSYVLRDPLTKIALTIYDSIAGSLSRMSERMFKNFQ